MPVIVTCHGTPPYDVAEMHIREWKMLGEQNGCIIIAPELLGTDGIFGDGPTQAMMDDEKFILSILSMVGYHYTVDWSNIMLTGFSGGGFPMYFTGLRNPNVFSVLVARSCNFNEAQPRRVVSAGGLVAERDDLRRRARPGAIQAQTDAAIAYLRSKGFRLETKVIPGIGHERVPEVAMDFFRRHMRPTVSRR